MTGLIATLLSTLGATGIGSILKIIGGLIDRIGAAKEAKEKRELVREIERGRLDVQFQQAVFGNDEGGRFARGTRRILAIIGMLNFAAISILAIIWPGAELVTFPPPGRATDVSILWGFISWPVDPTATVVITTGHLALMAMFTLAAIVGFYFTPGGRTK